MKNYCDYVYGLTNYNATKETFYIKRGSFLFCEKYLSVEYTFPYNTKTGEIF